MATTGAIRAGRAFVELFADDSQLQRGLKRASAKLKAWGASVGAMGRTMVTYGAAVAGAIIAASKVYAGMGGSLAEMSERTGASVEALSELSYAAQRSGSDVESLEKGLRLMQKTIVKAAQGGSQAQEALAELGLSFEDLDKLAPDQQFALIADRLSKIENPALRTAEAMAIFGRGGAALLPLMKDGAAGIDALRQKARDLGLTISTEDAEAAHVFEKALFDLWAVIKRATFAIGAAATPAIQEFVTWLTGAVKTAVAWINANRGLIVTILKLAAGVVVAGVGLMVLGKVLVAAGLAVKVFSMALSVASAVISAVGAVIGFLTSPVGLVIVAVAALAGVILWATGAGGKALDWLGKQFAGLKDDAVKTWEGIGDALAAGDIGLAARILWLTLKMEFYKGVKWLTGLWLGFRNLFIRIGAEAWGGLLIIAEYVWHALEVGWIETTNFLSQTWTAFTSVVTKAWNWCGLQLTKAWNQIKGLFDDSFNADAANAAADQAYQAGISQINQQAQAELAAREKQRESERANAKAVHDATLAKIVQNVNDKEKALDDEYDAKLAAAQEEIDKAKAEWDAARRQAKDQRNAKPAPAPGAPKGPDFSGLGGLMADKLKQTIGVRGTFNAMEIAGMQGGLASDRLTKAAEKTAENTAKIAKRLEEMDGAEFD